MAVSVNQLKRDMKKEIDKARAIHDKAAVEKRELTTDEKVEYNKIMDDVDQRKINIREEERKLQEELSGELLDIEDGPFGSYRSKEAKPKAVIGEGNRDFRSMFYGQEKRGLDKGGFDSPEEFLKVVASKRYDDRLKEARAMGTSVGAAGGFSVPEELSGWLLDASLEGEIIRKYAQVWPITKGNELKIPAWNNSDRSDGSVYGGFSGQWLGETEEATPQDAEVRRITLKAEKLGIYTDVSNELINDGMGFSEQLESTMGDAISFFNDTAFITGNGIKKPLGLINDPALMTINRTNPNEIVYLDLVAMFAKLYQRQNDRPIIIAANSTKPSLMTLTDANNNLIMQSSAREGMPNMLLGMPVYFTEKLPQLGNPNDIMMANLRHYAIGLKKEMAIDVANTPGWYRDLTSFRIITRVDGQGTWEKPVTTASGEELSWVVGLN